MLKYMLDTDTCIYVIKNRPAVVGAIFNRNDGLIAISAITLSELSHGVEKSSNIKKNRDIVEDFVSRLVVLDYSPKASAHYGDIRTDLERRGEVIGVNDLHIAGHCRSEGLVLVTNNTREFKRVDGLRIENWVEDSLS